MVGNIPNLCKKKQKTLVLVLKSGLVLSAAWQTSSLGVTPSPPPPPLMRNSAHVHVIPLHHLRNVYDVYEMYKFRNLWFSEMYSTNIYPGIWAEMTAANEVILHT